MLINIFLPLRCFPLFLNKFLSRIRRKKTFSRQKSYFFGKNCEKTTPKRSVFGKKKFRRIFYAFFYVFTTLMGLKCLPLFLHKFHKMCRLWGKKPTFLAKTVKKRREKAVFFQIKNFLAHFLWFLLCFYHFEWSEVKKLSTRNAKKLSTQVSNKKLCIYERKRLIMKYILLSNKEIFR